MKNYEKITHKNNKNTKKKKYYKNKSNFPDDVQNVPKSFFPST